MKIVTFGEIMLRLSPEGRQKFLQNGSFRTFFGGSEANTAIALKSLGADASFVTKLPQNDIAESCVRELRSVGIDTTGIVYGGERIGIYYCENGAGIRAGKVIYDRKNSAISAAEAADFDWDCVFEGADWFHFTGITSALSDTLADIVLTVVSKAKEKGLKVSCDLNYRSNLWSREKAGKVMAGYMPYVDVLFANEGSAYDVFGTKEDCEENTMRSLADRFGFETVAFTRRRGDSADRNTLGAVILSEDKFWYAKDITVDIVDRVGGGDCFDAGVIFGIGNNMTMQHTVDFANTCNAYKHTIEGDYCLLNKEEIESICSGESDFRIKR